MQQRKDMARTDAMAKAMHGKDTVIFGTNISKSYKKVIPNTSNVNGANDPTAILVESLKSKC